MSISYTADQLQKKFPGPPGGTGFARIAETLREEGRHEEAVALCQEGLGRKPHDLTGRLVLGPNRDRAVYRPYQPTRHRPLGFRLNGTTVIVAQFKDIDAVALAPHTAWRLNPEPPSEPTIGLSPTAGSSRAGPRSARSDRQGGPAGAGP